LGMLYNSGPAGSTVPDRDIHRRLSVGNFSGPLQWCDITYWEDIPTTHVVIGTIHDDGFLFLFLNHFPCV